jgi:hypothetical protein
MRNFSGTKKTCSNTISSLLYSKTFHGGYLENYLVLLLLNGFVLCYILEIELIEMGKPAVLTPDSKMPAPYGNIMGTCDVAVPALNGLCEVPDIIASDFVECPWLGDILNTGDENTRRPAVITRHLRLIWHC